MSEPMVYITFKDEKQFNYVEYKHYQALEEKLRVAMEALKNECNCSGEKCYTTGKNILCDPCEALQKLKDGGK